MGNVSTSMPSEGKNIRLFISDIDGCIAEPYRPYQVEEIGKLTRLIASVDEPRFTLCSGRAYPYVEAVTQVLGVQTPVIFESGGGMFDPVSASITWNPNFHRDVEVELAEIGRWLRDVLVPGTSMMFDYGKRTQAGVIGPYEAEVLRAADVVERHVASNHPGFTVYHTSVSVDVVFTEITKRQAMSWIAESLGLALPEIAFIGDTNGDLGALDIVGRSFSPANGTEAVRSAVQTVTAGSVIDGVIEAYRTCIHENASRESIIQTGT